MAEVLGAVAAVTATLEQCIKLFVRIRAARGRARRRPELLLNHSEELSRAKAMIELVEAKEALRTPNVLGALLLLSAIIESLRVQLDRLATEGRMLWGIRALLFGSNEEDMTLDGIMKDIANATLDLGLHMQLAHVGVTRGVGETVLVSVAAVEEMNNRLHERLGWTNALMISRILEGRPKNDDGTVSLTNDEINLLLVPTKHPALKLTENAERRGPRLETNRTVRDNEASQYALQVNTPVGQDLWEEVSTVKIERNRATGHASQLNYPTSLEALIAVLEGRGPRPPGIA